MVDEVKAVETPPVVADADDAVASFNEGFLEGLEDESPDPLDFVDKPVSTDVTKTVVAQEDDEPETPPVVEPEKDTPPVAEPPPVAAVAPADTAKILDMLDKRLPKEPVAPVAAAPEPEPEVPALTEAESARLVELQSEWKDVGELTTLLQKQQSVAIAKEVARQVAEFKASVTQTIQPLQQSIEFSAEERYDSAVAAVHPELYDAKTSKAFGDEVVAWIASQPVYLQDAYVSAVNSPNPKDAIDLITRFKADTGKVTVAAAETPETPEPTAAVDTADKANKETRLRQLQKPTSRKTKGAETEDSLDFEGGFMEVARAQQRAG